MNKISFSSIAPSGYLAVPTNFKEDNDLSMIMNNLSDALIFSGSEKGSQSLAEHAAMIMDEYFKSSNGTSDMYTLQDLSYSIGKHFSGAMEVLTDVIAPEVEMLTTRIDQTTKEYLDRKLAFTDKDGKYTSKAPKFKLLDIGQLYQVYHESAKDCAINLCKKYNYHIDILNDNNINGLLNRIEPVKDISVSRETLNAILEDIVVTVVADKDGEVTIDTNAPDAVTVGNDGDATVTDTNESGNDTGTETTEDTPEANVSVTTDNDDANVSINIGGDEITTEDKEMLATMISACFSTSKFNQLRKEMFADKGSVRDTHLLNSLFYVTHPIQKLMDKCASKHLNPNTMMMVRTNLANLHELQMGTLIFLDVSSSRFANKLIINKTLLNKNQVVRAQNEGIDIYPIIRDYLRVYHNDDENDLYHEKMQNQAILKGIDYDQVLITRYDVEQKLIQAKEATKENYQQLLLSARQEAFKSVMQKYTLEVADRGTNEELNVKENDKASFVNRNHAKIQTLHNQMVQNKNTSNVEDLIYSFYLTNWYGGTLVENMYLHIGEYLRQSANRETLSESTIAMVKAEAITTLGVKYLFDNFIHA